MLLNSIPNNDTPAPMHFHLASVEDIKKIPGSPIAYWISDSVRGSFEGFPPLGKRIHVKTGLQTGDNQLFIRQWTEVAISKISILNESLSGKKMGSI